MSLFRDMLHSTNQHILRKYVIFSLLIKCLYGRVKCLRGPEFGDPCSRPNLGKAVFKIVLILFQSTSSAARAISYVYALFSITDPITNVDCADQGYSFSLLW